MTLQDAGQALSTIVAMAVSIYWGFYLASKGWKDGRGKVNSDVVVKIIEGKL